MGGEGLDWTTVHPASLHNKELNNRVNITMKLTGEGRTSRDTLASALVACLDMPQTSLKSFALLDGDAELITSLRSM